MSYPPPGAYLSVSLIHLPYHTYLLCRFNIINNLSCERCDSVEMALILHQSAKSFCLETSLLIPLGIYSDVTTYSPQSNS